MDEKQTKGGPPDTTGNSDNHPGTDMRRILKIVVELNISRKNIFSYPPGHDQIQQSLERAFQVIDSFLQEIPSFTLGISGESLMVEVERPGTLPTVLPLDPSHVACRDLARTLKQYNLATMKIFSGLDREELHRLLSVISQQPEFVADQGGLESVFNGAGLENIEVQMIDYSKFRVTEEEEIRPQDNTETSSALWENFITHLISQTLSETEPGVSAAELEKMEPVRISRYFRENPRTAEAAKKAYEKTVAAYFSASGEGFTAPAGDSSGESGTAASDLKNWGTLIQQLDPEKKRQFLPVPFWYLTRHSDSPRVQPFLRNLPGGLVVDMLQQARQDGREISPPLLGLISRTAEETKIPDSWQKDEIKKAVKAAAKPVAPPADGDRQEDDGRKETAAQEGRFVLEDYLPTMEDAHLNIKIARLLIAFMNGRIEAEEYRIFADKLVGVSANLLDIPDFPLLNAVLKTFYTHLKKKKEKEIRNAAVAAVQTLIGPQFVDKAVTVFLQDETAAGKEGANFLMQLGPVIVPDLVKGYAEREAPDLSDSLRKIFSRYSHEVAGEAYKRLDESRPLFTRKLIGLIRIMKKRQGMARLQKFLQHENTEIRMEALETLLDFEDEQALSILHRMLGRGSGTDFSRAVHLAGKYRVQETAPLLAAQLKRRVFFKSDHARNIDIIEALGQIGSPEVLPQLEKFVRNRWPLYLREKNQAKLTLFQSLPGYPREALQSLIERGCRMRNADIRAFCRKLIKQASSSEA